MSKPSRHGLFIIPAGIALLAGLNAGLLLLGLPAPLSLRRLGEVHGLLMVLGFLGTVIALERAVAAKHRAAFLAPAGFGAGGLALLTTSPRPAAGALFTIGAVSLLLVYRRIWLRQQHPVLLVEAAGALLACGAALLWWRGVDVPDLLPWLVGFVVLTIAGERVELSALGAPTADAAPAPLLMAASVVLATVAATLWPPVGSALLGAALLAFTAWLVAHDIGRRTIRGSGLPRFSAASILAGYAWLTVAGVIWLGAGPVNSGSLYDALVHSVFLGFALSMVLAHAPIILPAVLRTPLPYHALMWLPLILLHGSLAVRVLGGDLRDVEHLWQWGGTVNVIAVLLFVVLALTSAIGAARRRPTPTRIVGATTEATPA